MIDNIDYVYSVHPQPRRRAAGCIDPAVVEAAGVVDEVFWQPSERIERGEVADEAQWFATTSRMEAARLAFVNIAKGHALGSRHRLNQPPIRRPDGYMPSTVDPGELPATS